MRGSLHQNATVEGHSFTNRPTMKTCRKKAIWHDLGWFGAKLGNDLGNA